MATDQWGAASLYSRPHYLATVLIFCLQRTNCKFFYHKIYMKNYRHTLTVFYQFEFCFYPKWFRFKSLFLFHNQFLTLKNTYISLEYIFFDFFKIIIWKTTFWRFEWYQFRLDIPTPSELNTRNTVWSPTGYLVRTWFTASLGDL